MFYKKYFVGRINSDLTNAANYTKLLFFHVYVGKFQKLKINIMIILYINNSVLYNTHNFKIFFIFCIKSYNRYNIKLYVQCALLIIDH